MNFLKKTHWSPYISGIILGLLQIPIFLFLNASIGSSGAFHGMACSVLSLFGCDELPKISQCFPALKNWWQMGFVIGIVMGAYISSKLSGIKRQSFSPVWKKAANITSFRKRAIMSFMGGFIMLMGARIADGCTSGNGLSGIALLSMGSMIVIVSMFLAGILVSLLYKKI